VVLPPAIPWHAARRIPRRPDAKSFPRRGPLTDLKRRDFEPTYQRRPCLIFDWTLD
jgi:hypothetical protein